MTYRPDPIRRAVRLARQGSTVFACAAALLITAGCGVLTATPAELYSAERTDDGTPLNRDDIQAILDDPDLTDEEKREALRALGIEDENLIDALLAL